MSFEYDVRQITHGNCMAFDVPITTDDTTGKLTFGTPSEITGLIDNNFSTSQNQTPFYADNVTHITLNGSESTTGTIDLYQVSVPFMSNYLGKKVIVSGDAGTKPNVVLLNTGTYGAFFYGYQETVTTETGAEYPSWTFYTNVKASAPTGTSTTDTDSITPKTFSIPVTCSTNSAIVDPDNGKAVSEINCDDIDGSLTTIINGLFGTSPTSTFDDLLNYLIPSSGTTPTP
ncbi:MAG: phage tail protein [Lactococcus lactis]|nr:phage tail protein [Lactococcus lactis]